MLKKLRFEEPLITRPKPWCTRIYLERGETVRIWRPRPGDIYYLKWTYKVIDELASSFSSNCKTYVDEEGVEPPVNNKQSDWDLVAAEDLYLLPWVPGHQADVEQAAAGECCVEPWRMSELGISVISAVSPTRYDEEKEDILIENTPQAPLGGKFVCEVECWTGERQTQEK